MAKDKPPTDDQPLRAPQSFGVLDEHIDGIHARIQARVNGQRSVAFETISQWQEINLIGEKQWYTRFCCDSIYEYCDKFYKFSKSYVDQYLPIARLSPTSFIDCIIPTEALRRAALHLKGPSLDVLAACTRTPLKGNMVIDACALAGQLKDQELAAQRLREWLLEGKTMPRRRRQRKPATGERDDVTARQAHGQARASLTAFHNQTLLIKDFAAQGELGDKRSRRGLKVQMGEARTDIDDLYQIIDDDEGDGEGGGGPRPERRARERAATKAAPCAACAARAAQEKQKDASTKEPTGPNPGAGGQGPTETKTTNVPPTQTTTVTPPPPNEPPPPPPVRVSVRAPEVWNRDERLVPIPYTRHAPDLCPLEPNPFEREAAAAIAFLRIARGIAQRIIKLRADARDFESLIVDPLLAAIFDEHEWSFRQSCKQARSGVASLVPAGMAALAPLLRAHCATLPPAPPPQIGRAHV